MQDMAAPGAFVQVVDILGYDAYAECGLKLSQDPVGGIWNTLLELVPTLVIKCQHLTGIPFEGPGRCDLFDPVTFPQTVCIAERLNPALCANPGTRQYGDSFHSAKIPLNATGS
jgi:hypothetical protein